MTNVLLVALGGMAGSVARYWIVSWVQFHTGSPFPFGTLVVNIAGSFVLGLLVALTIERGELGTHARLLLGVGFCGGFTTMSTFGYETIALMRDGAFAAGIGNVLLSLATCLAAVWLGGVIGRQW
ncbi:MAG: fluoride efflux transporter CrcB [Candidatus Binatia bacterium]